jgi:hypothetical protein
MSEPWFNPNMFAWIPGTLLGCSAGVWGALAGTLAPRGKARSLVIGLMWTLVAASIVLLAVAVVAFASGQPYGIWYGFGLAGFIGITVLGINVPNVLRVYRAAEERRMEASDLGR